MTRTGQIAAVLEAAARILRSGDNPARAAWRVADAGLSLHELIEADGEHDDVQGVHWPTGMGAMLPN